MNVIRVLNPEEACLAPYLKLTEAQLKRAGEDGLFIAESINVVKAAVAGGYRPVSFLTEEKYVKEIVENFSNTLQNTPIYIADDGVFEKITGFHLSRGVLAAMERRPLKSVEETLFEAERIAVLEGIVDATNIGAIFRSAAALGMDAVLVGSSCCDPLNRRAARVSMGTVFQIPWTVLPCMTEDKHRTDLEALKKLGFNTAAMALDDNSVSIDAPVLKNEKKLAVILGAEGYGLQKKTIENCDHTVKIPMYNGVDSLNVAAASAVAFWVLSNNKNKMK